MKLFDDFKREMPSNEQLCKAAAGDLLSGLSKDQIKRDFSLLLEQLNSAVYAKYLDAQNQLGQQVLEARATYELDGLFNELDGFYMSIFQSRKARAGGAFEYVIRELFIRLGYPFSTQVNVEGARPDFVLPSEDHLRRSPLDCIIFTAKRTLRERWRQVVTEANKGYGFFLATIDDKVASSQIEQMATHKVYLVVPASLLESNESYDAAHNVMSFEVFFLEHLDPALERWRRSDAISPFDEL